MTNPLNPFRRACKRVLFCVVPVVVAYIVRIALIWDTLPYLVCYGGECTLCKAGSSPCLEKLPSKKTEEKQPKKSKRYLTKLSKVLGHRAEQRALEGQPFTILLIGPNEFVDEPEEYQELFNGSLSQVRIVVVEPQLQWHPMIRNNTAAVDFMDVKIIHAAVETTGAGFPDMWWYESECLQKVVDPLPDFAQGDIMKYSNQWTTLNRTRLTAFVRHHFMKKLQRRMGMSQEAYDRLSADMLSCIKPMRVPSLNVADLMEAAGLETKQLDMLVVDAEGVDILIVEEFLKRPGFKPIVVQWEWTGYDTCCNPRALLDQMTDLSRRGYDVHQFRHDFTALWDVRIDGFKMW